MKKIIIACFSIYVIGYFTGRYFGTKKMYENVYFHKNHNFQKPKAIPVIYESEEEKWICTIKIDDNGVTPLMMAIVSTNSVDLIQFLIRSGADIKKKMQKDMTLKN